MSAAPSFAFTLNKACSTQGDVRGMLLKLATEQFLENAYHNKEDAKQFGDLAIGFLTKSDLNTQLEIAEKLVERSDLPENLFEFLVNIHPTISALFVAKSPMFDDKKIAVLANHAQSETLAAIARRPKLSAKVVETLIQKKDMVAIAALIENESIKLPAKLLKDIVRACAEEPKVLRRLMAREEAAKFSPLDFFLDAPSEMRLQGLEALVDFEAEIVDPEISPMAKAVLAGIDAAALTRSQSQIVETIKQALGLTTATASRIVLDPYGEPLALVLRAIGAKRDMIERVLIFGVAGEQQKTHSIALMMDILSVMTIDKAREVLGQLMISSGTEAATFKTTKTQKKKRTAAS